MCQTHLRPGTFRPKDAAGWLESLLLKATLSAGGCSVTGAESARMLHVVAMITAVPGKRGPLLEAFLANVPAVLAEAGCIEYAPAVDADFGGFQAALGPETFVVIEKWANAEALRAHAASPHMAAYRTKTETLVASSAVHVLDAVN